MTNREKFTTLYAGEILVELKKDEVRPEREKEYCYGPDKIPVVVEKMTDALAARGANINSNPLKRVCRKLGIKHTIGEISLFLQARPSAGP